MFNIDISKLIPFVKKSTLVQAQGVTARILEDLKMAQQQIANLEQDRLYLGVEIEGLKGVNASLEQGITVREEQIGKLKAQVGQLKIESHQWEQNYRLLVKNATIMMDNLKGCFINFVE